MKERMNATLLPRYNIILKVCLFVCLYINDVMTWECNSYDRFR